jgi:hypothetical protein
MGAMGVLTKPIKTKDSLDQTFTRLAEFIAPHSRRLLLIEPDAEQRDSLVGMIAGEEVRLERSAARAVVSEDRVEMRQAAAQMILAAGDVSMTQAGAQAVASNGSIRIERGGAGIAVGRRIEVGEHALVVVGIAPSLNMTGGRVLFGPVAAATVIGGVIAALFAVRVLLRRGRAVEGGNRS